MMLREGKLKEGYLVEEIQLGDKIRRRLQILGLTRGTRVEVLNRKKNGTIVMKVRGTRFAAGKEVAEGIQVREPKNQAIPADSREVRP
ncbi:MAG: ferrous iron transport protein A [Lachnospiraceae bacterium]|nr:ferrous iron transport protein A [Lachnospiraceae bacterium]